MNGFENAHLSLYYFLLLFYKFIANTITDRLNFCESNNFMLVTLPDCKLDNTKSFSVICKLYRKCTSIFLYFYKYVGTSTILSYYLWKLTCEQIDILNISYECKQLYLKKSQTVFVVIDSNYC